MESRTCSLGRLEVNILLVAHGFPPHQIGGTQLHTLDLALALIARGYGVDVLCPGRADQGAPGDVLTEDVQGVRVFRLLMREPARDPGPEEFRLAYDNPHAEAGFRKIVRRIRPDLVHFHHFHDLSASMALAAREMGVPSVLTLHDLWVLCEQPHFLRPDLNYCQEGPVDPAACAACLAGRRPGWNLSGRPEVLAECFRERLEFMRAAVASLSGVVCLGRFQAERLTAFGMRPQRIFHVPLGLPPLPRRRPFHHPASEGADIRLVCLGIVAPSKGTDLVVKALGLAGWEGFRLDVHGILCDQAYYDAMRSMHPPDRVHWHGGYLPKDLPDILAATDAVVMPSRSENTPLVVMESLEHGVPVVGADVGGVVEMLGHGSWGLTFANGDQAGLARQLGRLRNESGLLARLRANIPPLRSIGDETSDLIVVYRECLG